MVDLTRVELVPVDVETPEGRGAIYASARAESTATPRGVC
jgi:hypothetical protein